ncbi:nucleotidyltransferase family protein [Galbibacter sp. EGI 63066]|uniref:nucleotidyltransferase family protein n=1 Tax=Galbibacter sp. EGI 63066 TaxID=2993559 RepID=UPI00224987B3|nr:nucleotidyltransferase family protein [Galbibacter sp. EGI 63066]MCX2679943.1 nucleotidyltransferase family protein [Galbibacter sp. EGI 63066]
MKTAIVILAAGASTRMGQPKQLLKWGDTTLLGHSVFLVRNTVAEALFVVLGANAKQISKTLDENVEVLLHKDWEKGLGTSIAFAVSELEKKNFDGLLFILADQPFVTSAYLNQLIKSFHNDGKGIVASKFNGRMGVPAIFSSTYFEMLKKLNSDVGAKHIIQSHQNDLKTFKADDLITDLDTMEDYERALKDKLK